MSKQVKLFGSKHWKILSYPNGWEFDRHSYGDIIGRNINDREVIQFTKYVMGMNIDPKQYGNHNFMIQANYSYKIEPNIMMWLYQGGQLVSFGPPREYAPTGNKELFLTVLKNMMQYMTDEDLLRVLYESDLQNYGRN